MSQQDKQPSYFSFYGEGESAFNAGLDRKDCPYEHFTTERDVWMSGYGDAKCLAREAVI